MKMNTKFLGVIDIEENQVVFFPNGLPGFEGQQKYAYIEIENSVFSCLQSIEEPGLAFVTISPFLLCNDYTFTLDSDVIGKIKIAKSDDALILSLVTVPVGQPTQATANLQAPVVISRESQLGLQMILPEKNYPLRQPIWNQGKAAQVNVQAIV